MDFLLPTGGERQSALFLSSPGNVLKEPLEQQAASAWATRAPRPSKPKK